jgi:AcrR family transcriptional regulator
VVNGAVEAEERAPRRVRMTRAQRREHFLDVAADLVVESGLESVTMERVAARAGVSKALGYAYFDNSDALLAALFDREMASYDRAIAAATEHASTFEERIRGAIVAMFDMVAERGELFGTLLNGRSPEGSSLGERRCHRKAMAEAHIGRLIAAEYAIPASQAVSLASMWLAAASGAIDSWIERRGSRRELTDLFVAACIGGAQRVAGR